MLNFSTQKTMRIAQQLYEGVDVKDRAPVGLITYLRTDSTRIADEADAAARAICEDTFGADYVLQQDQTKKSPERSRTRMRPSVRLTLPDPDHGQGLSAK